MIWYQILWLKEYYLSHIYIISYHMYPHSVKGPLNLRHPRTCYSDSSDRALEVLMCSCLRPAQACHGRLHSHGDARMENGTSYFEDLDWIAIPMISPWRWDISMFSRFFHLKLGIWWNILIQIRRCSFTALREDVSRANERLERHSYTQNVSNWALSMLSMNSWLGDVWICLNTLLFI